MNTFGLQRLIDSHQRVFGTQESIFYVVDNFVLTQEASELGMAFVPSISGGLVSGTTQYLIDPEPDVSPNSASYVNAAIQSGVNLRMGSLRFTVSATWVEAMRIQRGFAAQEQVFYDKTVEGLMFNGKLYNIVKALSNEGVGNTLSWDVQCNAPTT